MGNTTANMEGTMPRIKMTDEQKHAKLSAELKKFNVDAKGKTESQQRIALREAKIKAGVKVKTRALVLATPIMSPDGKVMTIGIARSAPAASSAYGKHIAAILDKVAPSEYRFGETGIVTRGTVTIGTVSRHGGAKEAYDVIDAEGHNRLTVFFQDDGRVRVIERKVKKGA